MEILLNDGHVWVLRSMGAVAVPALSEFELARLNKEIDGFLFHPREPVTKTGVIQNLEAVDALPLRGGFWGLVHGTVHALNAFFGPLKLLQGAIEFNDFTLQRYRVSTHEERYAISPHRDHRQYINIIAVYILRGHAPFCVCEDRSGANPVEIPTNPGDLILMRGIGFAESVRRPFHYVGPVTEERLTFGLRQSAS